MNIIVIAHSQSDRSRTTVYRTALSGQRNITFRVGVKLDPYEQQRSAVVDIFDHATNRFNWFFAIEDKSTIATPSNQSPAMWETEDSLVAVIARHLSVPFSHFDTEVALSTGGYLEE